MEYVEEEDTDTKLAILASILTETSTSPEELLELLLQADGSVEKAVENHLDKYIGQPSATGKRKPLEKQNSIMDHFGGPPSPKRLKASSELVSGASGSFDGPDVASMLKWTESAERKKREFEKPLHVYLPEHLESLAPCTLHLNFLPPDLAKRLTQRLLDESKTWKSNQFRLFDKTVSSPHTTCFYVEDGKDWVSGGFSYNGKPLPDVRMFPPELMEAKPYVTLLVNKILSERERMRYQIPAGEWEPNVAFTNLYAGAHQSVGAHADQLTYLGPHCVIASLSLGVEREFRIRKTTPGVKNADSAARALSIHLPDNSLLIMHPPMQETYKHSIHPARTLTPHPIIGTSRINITYRMYRKSYVPPDGGKKCRCGVTAVLKTVMKQEKNAGRWCWMCDNREKPCGFFEWAEFEESGELKAR
ncbi:hypothetical protein SAICODRAFT_31046 [Saitoella complicata NRRL Y-17804]|uniref:Uncharacterized protein n=1 Tax=Saitoella complicata (strain BCRC 22490 / CBS 7301 / JCM 7358 / NBRC 10748 / NRRL Y-17804) TaxID=698492 RepID=A0A0E9NGS3_SAICN|nr:uncharacterized protein SAICODRAFT_31046 [Saitoella complicata NRRL Y-17804]ODQ52002.1 hypothetical protein SAICODRAFT_31046 [Saitoella complicata NRRL Y-17804]GAO48610.1 hypothetical protein G7K_2781-t1 [Saitoella complicata NRRL Y-17804]